MGATLDALQRLQEIEVQLAEFRQRIASKKRSATAQEKRLQALLSEQEEKKAAIRTRQMDADRLELDIKAGDERIAKLRVALNSVKTNKEYSAILTQLNTDKSDNSKIEERLIAVLGEIDAAKQELTAFEEKIAAERVKLQDLQRACAEEEARAAGPIAKLQAERDAAAKNVPPTALEVFERLAEKNNGEAMAAVVRTHPKREEFACGGCNMSVNVERVNALMTRDDPLCCSICGRILYLDESFNARTR